MYGTCTVTLDASGQTIDMENCLTPYFDDFMASFDFNTLIPSPAIYYEITICYYYIYITDMTYDSVIVILTPTIDGMQLHCTYQNITAFLYADGHGFGCPDDVGTLTIDSATVDAEMIFSVTPEKSVDVAFTNMPMMLYDIDADIFILVDLIIIFLDNLASDFDSYLAIQFQAVMEPLLEGMLVP